MQKNGFSTAAYFNKHGVDGVFRIIIDNNIMCHREMASQINSQVMANNFTTLDILDLGCGPAFHIAKSFYGITPISYTGVDTSIESLKAAKNNISMMSNLTQSLFLNADFLDELARLVEKKVHYDLVLSSYAQHHLNIQKKKLFFELVYAVLKKNRAFFLIDMINPEKTKGAWLRIMKEYMVNTGKFSSDMIEDSICHMSESDFPENVGTLRELGASVGFKDNKVCYILPEKEKIYTFIRFFK